MPFQFLKAVCFYVPQRWVICALCSWALAIISYKKRFFIEVFVVIGDLNKKRTTEDGDCPFFYSFFHRNEFLYRQLNMPHMFWDRDFIQTMISTYYIGLALTAVPAGLLADLGYSKTTLGGGVFLQAVSLLLLPLAADGAGGSTMFVLRSLVDGIGTATTLPSVISLISHWVPPKERNTLTAVVIVGIYYGSAIAQSIFQLLYVGMSFDFGFYSAAVIGLLWTALWFLFGYNSPDDSPYITYPELRHCTVPDQTGVTRPFRSGVPWRRIVTSRSFLSLILAYCALDWAFKMIIGGMMRSYQENILHIPKGLRLTSAFLKISELTSALVGGALADWMVRNKVISNTSIKKLFLVISVSVPSLLTVMIPLAGCKLMLFAVIQVVASFANGLAGPTLYSNPIDLSPNHAGLIMAIMKTFDTLCSIFTAEIMNRIVADSNNIHHWWFNFGSSFVIVNAMIVPFLFFASGEQQQWNVDERNRETHNSQVTSTNTL